jgi:hypothetical protein
VLAALLLLANAAATSRAPAAPTVAQPATGLDAATVAQPHPGGDRIMGVIDLDSSAVAGVPYPLTVFVYARAENTSAGPPLAALRLHVTSFPVAFVLGPEHAMIGGTLPPIVRVEARTDPDGNATTREPGALHGLVTRVELGATEVRILLK